MGGGHTCSASSTMSIARSTPAQNPRGPASTISCSGFVAMREVYPTTSGELAPPRTRPRLGRAGETQMRASAEAPTARTAKRAGDSPSDSHWLSDPALFKIKANADGAGVGFDAAVGVLDVAVGEVVEAVAAVERHALRHEVLEAHADLEDERDVRPDLLHVQARPAHA